MRNSRESAIFVEKAIREIKRTEDVTDQVIQTTCSKYNINEDHIRAVGGWNPSPKWMRLKINKT